ncbi:MAG: hypothetical protein MI861_18455 [Pirellulales bacterium]|nr:hypothetical protein [Pirellulales bacterium]
MTDFRPSCSHNSAPPLGGDPMDAPQSIAVLRTLGQGRAARAQLVTATMSDGRALTCVEKVFSPGLLTRSIYRISFQAPFAYQSNADAILACFYRRRVAAAVLAASDTDVGIARPLYVRFDQQHRCWVLAAEWIDGRGIKPAPPDTSRIKRRFRNDASGPASDSMDEIDELVQKMHQLEELFAQSGLVGSGWQVAPKALVSTANLLRVGDRYTIIDLESGIPAVLVPRYLWQSLRTGSLPPFDDLNPLQLQNWLNENRWLLNFRIGLDEVNQLQHDVDALIEHTRRWKQSEMAVLRRPWRHLTAHGVKTYQSECIRRWRQDGLVDPVTADSLPERPFLSRWIWWASVLPSSLGRLCGRLVGNRTFRADLGKRIQDRQVRQRWWQKRSEQDQRCWAASGRIAAEARPSPFGWLIHHVLERITPAGVHRFLVDRNRRREQLTNCLLLAFSSRYQSWMGVRHIETSIERWQSNQRISPQQAQELRQDLCANEVHAYARGFGMHLALKTLAPVIVPAKVGGVAAFLASGNLWFLLPMFLTPLMRTMVTLANAWSTRHQQIPHGEALMTGWLPLVGLVAFPLQMFSTRPKLSTFLIRDTASKLGRKIPIYGGSDSRTEIAMIRVTDYVIEIIQTIAHYLSRRPANRPQVSSSEVHPIHAAPRSGLSRWLDHQVSARIKQSESSRRKGNDQNRIAA